MGHNGEVIGPRRADVMEQAVDDELILFNPSTETYFTLNRSAREVWELVDGSRTLHDIASDLASRYGMDTDTLIDDVQAIVDSFVDASLI